MNKTKILKIALGCFVLYLSFLVIKLPAIQVLPRITPNNLSVQGIQGTLWQGQAERIYYQGIELERVTWRTKLLPLLLGRFQLELNGGNFRRSDAISARGNIAYGLGQTLMFEDLLLQAPAHLLAATVPMPLPVKLNGLLRVDLTNGTLTPEGCQQLTGSGEWRNAAVSGSQGWIELQQFSATLSCAQGDLVARVSPPNAFNLTADARVSPQQQLSASGKFKPSSALPKEVHQAASLFGQTDSQGFYQFNF